MLNFVKVFFEVLQNGSAYPYKCENDQKFCDEKDHISFSQHENQSKLRWQHNENSLIEGRQLKQKD